MTDQDTPSGELALSFARHLGFSFISADSESAVIEVTPLPEHCNEHGMVHGGFLSALLDTTTGWAIHAALPDASAAPHIQLTVQYLNPAAAGEPLRCVGRVTKPGRRIGATEAQITQNGIVIARGIASHAVLS